MFGFFKKKKENELTEVRCLMSKAKSALPDGYQPYLTVDLQKNKKLALSVSGVAILIIATMAVPMSFVVPINSLFDLSQGLVNYILRFAVLVVGFIAYIILHEAVHSVAMKLCGTKKVKFGFTGLYAFTGSNDYYDKASYIFIALSPVILWGIVLLIANFLVPVSWFWVVYFIQIINVSGAVGDAYVTIKFAKLPKDMLVQDSGINMTVYTKN